VTKRRFQRLFFIQNVRGKQEFESRQTYWNVVLKSVYVHINHYLKATREFHFPQRWKSFSLLIYFMGFYLDIFFKSALICFISMPSCSG